MNEYKDEAIASTHGLIQIGGMYVIVSPGLKGRTWEDIEGLTCELIKRWNRPRDPADAKKEAPNGNPD